MNDKKVKNLKRKIWFISTTVLLVYITLLIPNPSIWSGLLPIIIPAGSFTIGIPAFNIYKNINEKKERKKKIREYIGNAISNNRTIKKDKASNNSENKIIIENETSINIELDKPKVKTKGTFN